MTRALTFVAATLSLALAGGAAVATNPIPKESPMTIHAATGPFEVTLASQPPSEAAHEAGLARRSIAKQFHGALEARSTGEMLSSGDPASGSAGYVALERVRGTLDGRSGSFVLQHSSTLARGTPQQSITVVPDSGTEALAGLEGRMVVDIAPGGAHAYRFEYTLP